MVEYIYYDGIGAKKNGKHNVKEFLKIMNEHFSIECSEYLPNLDYKPCYEYKEMNQKAMEHNMKHNKPLFNYNRSKKTEKKRKCNLDEYLKFSGAETKRR